MKISTLKKSNEFAEFLGWHLGDGCISLSKSRYQYFLTGDLKEEQEFYNEIVLPNFNKLFNHILTKKVLLKKYASIGVCGIFVFDKKLIHLLTNKLDISYGKKINNFIPKYIKTRKQKIHFIRGLFDTDGSIYFCKSNYKTKKPNLHNIFHYKPKIKVATISKQLIRDVYNLLVSLGYSPRFTKPAKQRPTESIMYGVVIDIKKDIQKYLKEIGFKNTKHKTKVEIAKIFGFCPPFTKINQRKEILNKKINPLTFYTKSYTQNLNKIKKGLNTWIE